jgi:predicted nuclease of predicted toxin-antitoxin system
LKALREDDWDVLAIAEERPGSSDEEVAALCSEQERILLTFDKDFGELVFRRGLPVGTGVVLFRITPESPEEAGSIALELLNANPDLRDHFCVVTRNRVRLRPMRAR